MALLRWVISQVLIGNADAHAKNVTFFSSSGGISLAPAYDISCSLLYADDQFDSSYAMAIGKAFLPSELSACEWTSFCHTTNLNPNLVKRELTNLSLKLLGVLSQVRSESVAEGTNAEVLDRINHSFEESVSAKSRWRARFARRGRIIQIVGNVP